VLGKRLAVGLCSTSTTPPGNPACFAGRMRRLDHQRRLTHTRLPCPCALNARAAKQPHPAVHTPPSTLIAITILVLHARVSPGALLTRARPNSPFLAPSMKHLH
jgi:hypothetical protein